MSDEFGPDHRAFRTALGETPGAGYLERGFAGIVLREQGSGGTVDPLELLEHLADHEGRKDVMKLAVSIAGYIDDLPDQCVPDTVKALLIGMAVAVQAQALYDAERPLAVP